MRITGESKLFGGIILATIIIIGFGIAIFSKEPPPIPRGELLPSDTVIKGSKNTPVYLVEFSDFQCPSCRLFKEVVDSLTQKYGDKLLYGYRHFPLPQHPLALKAALAVEAANEQGKFWQLYDYFFSNQDQLSNQMIEDAGAKFNLDTEKYKEEIKSEKYKNKIERDIKDGKKFGIDATPTFFLNGKKLTLYTYDDLKTAVRKEMSN